MLKKTWDVIKEVIGSTKANPNSLPKRLTVNNVEILDKTSIAEHFNKYFVSVGPNLASIIPKPNKNFESFLTGNYQLFSDTPLTDEELEIAFTALKTNKSPGFDEISPNVVKCVFDAIIKPIKHIFGLSLNKGIFPDQLKIARVTPIFKQGARIL